MSNSYEPWFTNIHLMSGDSLVINNPSNSETIIYPIWDKDWVQIDISGANVLSFFAVYDVLWWKEYKPFSSSNHSWWSSIDLKLNENINFSNEIWLGNFLRNTFLDRWGKLIQILAQVSSIPWTSIYTKQIVK